MEDLFKIPDLLQFEIWLPLLMIILVTIINFCLIKIFMVWKD